jgi:hypothetical protein
MGFERAADARRMLADLKERLAKFGLLLHEDKTRLIEFGRLPALARRQRGERRPGTFAFLGFTHYCGWTRDGRFIVKRKTQSKRLTRKLTALRHEAWRHMHEPLAEQHRWYASILRGHYGYYGVSHNFPALSACAEAERAEHKRVCRRILLLFVNLRRTRYGVRPARPARVHILGWTAVSGSEVAQVFQTGRRRSCPQPPRLLMGTTGSPLWRPGLP